MSTEQEYDEQVAPALAEVARLCRSLGMALVARVEWAEPEQEPHCGITQVGNDEASVSQRLTHLAAHSGGNFDLLCIEAKKRFDTSASVFLSR